MSARKVLVGTTLAAVALYGGSAAATDYPPSSPTTVAASSTHGAVQPESPTPPGQLPSTGNSDTATLVEIGGAAVVAGLGLVVVARRRRHASAT
jgi:LPXTG-motif cell wall-anchored protein